MASPGAITSENVDSVKRVASSRFGWIADLKWSPAGETLAVCGGDGIALYRGGFSRSPSLRLHGHDAPVKAIAFSPDGRLLASVSADASVRIWSLDEARIGEARRLAGHRDSVNAVAFSPDGGWLATGGGDGELRFWSMQATGENRVLAGHDGEVTCLAFGAKGETLFSGGRDGAIRLWDLRREGSAVLHQGEGWPRALAMGEGGAILAAAFSDDQLFIWDFVEGKSTRWRLDHGGGADALAFAPGCDLILSGGRDGCLRFWDCGRGQMLRRIEAGSKPIMAAAFAATGAMFVSGGGDNWIHLWALDQTTSEGQM